MSNPQLNKKEELLKQKQKECENLYSQIKKLRQYKKLQITDHALVRYLERQTGINIQAVRDEILTQKLLDAYKHIGDGELPINDKVRAVVKNGTIITILK